MSTSMDDFKARMEYLGYSGVNLEKVNLNSFKNLMSFIPIVAKNPNYTNIDHVLASLPPLSVDQIRSLVKQFCEKYFHLHDVSTVSLDTIQAHYSDFANSNSPEEVYQKVNSLLTNINPTDLNVELIDGHALTGQIVKPLVLLPADLTSSLRKVYFSQIELGKNINLLSACTMIHEVAHAEQEQKIGYAEDFLNREIISIFLEKVSALELDPTGELLKISERVRFTDLMIRYLAFYKNQGSLNSVDSINDLLYIKSILYAEKLFDMYLNETKQKKRDTFFYEIQDVFDGKKTVEDIIRSRNITPAKAQDFALLKRHI